MRMISRHISALLKSRRIEMGLTQTQANKLLTRKVTTNGQFWSSIERGTCGLPLKHMPMVSSRLQIPLSKLREAHVMDLGEAVDIELSKIIGRL